MSQPGGQADKRDRLIGLLPPGSGRDRLIAAAAAVTYQKGPAATIASIGRRPGPGGRA